MRVWPILQVLILATLLFGNTFRFVWASADCDTLVVDEAGVFGSRFSAVESEAKNLVNAGADVRVRVVQTLQPYSNLDQYQESLEKNCSSWQSADGGRKNNLVLMMAAIKDRKSGVYYGGQWQFLGEHSERIRVDFMNPRFRDGDFASGFINGLKEVRRLVDARLHPQSAVAIPSVVVVTQSPPAPPPDLSGLWTILMWVVGIGAVFGISFLLYRGGSIYVANTNRRKVAQGKALRAKVSASSLILSLPDAIKELELKVQFLDNQVVDANMPNLRSDLSRAKICINEASQVFGDLNGSQSDPERVGLSAEEYQSAEEAYLEILGKLNQANELVQKVMQEISGLEALVQKLPKEIKRLHDELLNLEVKIYNITKQGYKTDASQALLMDAENVLLRASNMFFNEKRFMQAENVLAEVITRMTDAVSRVENYPKLKSQLDDALKRVLGRVEDIVNKIVQVRTVFEQISAEYDEGTWHSVKGNGTEAEKRVVWARKTLEEARSASSMERQEWEKAQANLDQASKWLDEADSILKSITSLKLHLDTARDNAAKEIATAQADIDRAAEYLKQYCEDVDGELLGKLKRIQAILDDAKDELIQTKPNYLRVVNLAERANHSADEILVEARSEHEAAERLRQKAATALRSAKAAVSKVSEFIEDHRYDIGSKAQSSLDSARSDLRSAESESNLNSLIEFSQRARKKAEEAYEKAYEDFEDAEEARRPRPSHTYVTDGYSGGYSGGSSGSSDSGSGSSSGWGSSSGGGGSSDWGSSSGGGSSGDWGSSSSGGGSSGSW